VAKSGFKASKSVAAFSTLLLGLFWKGLTVIDGGLDFRFWPFEMSGNCGNIVSVALNEEHYFPHSECAPLDVSLSART
jgi:hypothetical protein